ncbi:hypothetical protein WR25_20965 [Diploscapter pachys]|uniref:Uncharacterized protein n=1 Tax=Diploscapter pachys TaxID=2018661 RepID=A0A2A2JX40_9BILA|nr:hypothetical protein WR25_20965 [Diploscapter pachys]
MIQQMWNEEKQHLDTVERLAAKHNTRISWFTAPFSVAAYALGVGSALLGKQGAMACTAAVEQVVGEHYNNQIKELLKDDPERHKDLLKELSKMRDAELHHLKIGEEQHDANSPMYGVFKNVIQLGCKTAIEIAKRV